MDERHLLAAFRYVAMNPVKAGLAVSAGDWPWSSTPAHLKGRDDGLVTVTPLLDRVDSLKAFLAMAPDPALEAALDKGRTVGRPLMEQHALVALEARLGRRLRAGKRGRPPARKNDPRQPKLV